MTAIRSQTEPGRSRKGRAGTLLDQLEMWGLKLGLERIRAVLYALDRPDRAYRTVLVAGTNGKGTTAANLASILDAAGYRVGLFTSPHLESVRERIRVGGLALSDEQLTRCLEQVVDAAAKRKDDPLPSYFEAITAAALLHFQEASVDIAVLEVGLGGRLDATNVTDPVLSIITSIAHDHQEHLGARLDQIAGEKAGVARSGRPLLVWAPRQGGVQRVFRGLLAEGVEVEEVWRHLSIEPDDSDHKSRALSIISSGAPPATSPRHYRVQPSVLASHHGVNAAIAIRAAERLGALGFTSIDARSIERGIEQCHWPGRLEHVELTEASGNATSILLDGAHNPAGARALGAYLEARPPGPKPNLLFGSLRGKKAIEALDVLAQMVDRIWLTSPTSHRALNASDLMARLRRYRPELAKRCTAIDTFSHALEAAMSGTASQLVVCGSLYGVGEARTWLNQRFGVPTPAAEVKLFG